MPVVPFSRTPTTGPQGNLRAPPSEPFALMAAAQMHSEGRLLAQDQSKPHDIQDGPEYAKWDEAVNKYGSIRLPKELDNPQKWMNQFDKTNASNGITREDRPDGSVVLRKQVPTS